MSTEIDLKALWNRQQPGEIPDAKELIRKAYQLKTKMRNKLIAFNLVMLSSLVIIISVGCGIDNVKLTTVIGLVMVALAIVSYVGVYNTLIPLLLKTHMQSSSYEYLNQLISIKRKHEFLNKVMANIYFVLLSTGQFLYLLQFAMKMTFMGSIICYVVVFGWICFAWFYLRPRGIRKRQKTLNEMIEKLEAVNGQFAE